MQISQKAVRLAACLAMLAGSSLGAEPLPQGLGDWSPVVRAKVIPEVAKRGAAALPELSKALESSNSGLRHAATEVIAIIAKSERPPPSSAWRGLADQLIIRLEGDSDFWVRCAAASALQAIHFESAAPALITAARDENPWVSAAAVKAISGLPVKFFDSQEYLATAIRSLGAPRASTRSSGIAMLGKLGEDGKIALSAVEASVATYAQDSMFADNPRIEAIRWIARFDKRKAAALAGGLLQEERWGASSRYRRLLPILESLGEEAAAASDGLKVVVAKTAEKDNRDAEKARKILEKIK